MTHGAPVDENIERLLRAAVEVELTPEHIREQRISFVYGNLKIERPNITREEVEQAHVGVFGW